MLATCCLSLFLVTMDLTVVNVALPAIGRDLHSSVTGLQWAIDGYTVVIASFLMLAGSAADRFGRRRTFQLGLGLFCLGSLSCSLATTTAMLVGFRVLQALGGSMLNPVAMSIITNTFTRPDERARAIGVWGAVVGVSMAVGPLLGGVLTETIGWRAIFWINLPIGLAAIALTARFVPESMAQTRRRFDPAGQALIVVALAALTAGLIEGPHAGWGSPAITGAFVLAAAAVVALIVVEHRRTDPLIDLRFFQSLPLSAATVIAVLAFIGFAGFLFLSSLYLQRTRGLSAADTGFCLLPTALAMMTCAPLSGRLVGAGRARTALVTAGLAMALGALPLTAISAGTPLVRLVVAYGVFGVGLGLVNTPITNAAVSGMPRAQAGLAAAPASTSRQVGAALGVALSGSIAAGRARSMGPGFARATHPFWWLVVACSLAVAVLGVLSTGPRARASVDAIAHLLDPPEGAPAGAAAPPR